MRLWAWEGWANRKGSRRSIDCRDSAFLRGRESKWNSNMHEPPSAMSIRLVNVEGKTSERQDEGRSNDPWPAVLSQVRGTKVGSRVGRDSKWRSIGSTPRRMRTEIERSQSRGTMDGWRHDAGKQRERERERGRGKAYRPTAARARCLSPNAAAGNWNWPWKAHG